MVEKRSRLLSEEALAMTFALLSAFLYGFKGIFAKLAYGVDVTVPQLLFLRFLLATPLLWFVFLTRKKAQREVAGQPDTKLLFQVLLTGLLFGVATITDFIALSYLPVSIERMILFTFPVVVILIEALRNKRPPSLHELCTFFFVYLGLYLVTGGSQTSSNTIAPLGVALAFVSSISYAFFLVYSKRVVDRVGSLAFTTYSSTVTMCIVILYFLRPVLETGLALSPAGWAYLLLLVIFSTVLPSLFLMEGIKEIGSSKAGLISTASAVVTLIAAVVILGEQLSSGQALGAAIMLISIVWMKLRTA